ncbi:MAG TPA: hypothetical protein VFT84_13955 [Gemmatimonadales bacterium]|nr:hypothetical protein [Gemmatimonadales bacterium]
MLRFPRRSIRPPVAFLLLALAGCGGSDGDNGPVDPPPPPPVDLELRVAGGGNNVPDRYTSDLWVHGNYAYTGTWGGGSRGGNSGNVVKIWALDAGGAPTLADSLVLPGSAVATVSDVEVSEDGSVLMFSREGSADAGLYLYGLADPVHPAPLDFAPVRSGLHTATFAGIGGRRYAFAARNPPSPALEIYDVTDPTDIVLATEVPVPSNYGIHDTYVRDGIAFVFAWNTGVIIYDVGNGVRGGSPQAPVEVSRIVTETGEVAGGPAAHNGWWFHNPVTDERRYLFVGQEGPGIVGSASSGDIHVVDVSDLADPREVASFHLDGAGTHNFWMDEAHQILYAAYYNGGVVALDVTGTLVGDLAAREIARIQPGGTATYVWGVMLANGALWASDMESGFWKLSVP